MKISPKNHLPVPGFELATFELIFSCHPCRDFHISNRSLCPYRWGAQQRSPRPSNVVISNIIQSLYFHQSRCAAASFSALSHQDPPQSPFIVQYDLHCRYANAVAEGAVHAELLEHRRRRTSHLQLFQGQRESLLPHPQQDRQQAHLLHVSQLIGNRLQELNSGVWLQRAP